MIELTDAQVIELAQCPWCYAKKGAPCWATYPIKPGVYRPTPHPSRHTPARLAIFDSVGGRDV